MPASGKQLVEALKSDDLELKVFVHDVDRFFRNRGPDGNYLVKNLGQYMSDNEFLESEGLNGNRFKEFLHLYDDIQCPIAKYVLNLDVAEEECTLAHVTDEHPLFSASALDMSGSVLAPVILKMAYYYAKNNRAEIPCVLGTN